MQAAYLLTDISLYQNMIQSGMVPHYSNPRFWEAGVGTLSGGMHGYSGLNIEY